ncbi:nucleotide-binding alpha-beta plait domain-containing protein [Tanacetum coccineum]
MHTASSNIPLSFPTNSIIAVEIMETLGERNEVSVVSENKNKKKVIRVVKKIVKKKVIIKVLKPKPESNTESLLGVSSFNCDSFGSNDTSAVMNMVENDDSTHWDRIQVPNVKEEDEKGVCLVEKLSKFENVKDIDVHLVESEINGVLSAQNRVEDNDTIDVKVRELEQGLSESGVLSGQMVVSWWHKKQRRKIFVHGLDKETKEDDIRKVSETIGEVVEVKLITNLNSGKSREFGFVTYASADLADLALMKFRHVKIRGSTWHTAAVEANDAIVLNNIKWNNENVLSLLQKVGITKIDEVSVVPDPENSELNLGFAFIEFETKRDAQMAYRKLQIKNVFGEYSKIKVAWAKSLADPVEEQQKTCQAALSCIEALNNKRSTSENGPKAHPKVSLAKSIPKGKPVKIKSESAVTETSKVNQLSNQSRPSRIQYQNASQSTPSHSPYQNASQSRPSHSPYQNASQSTPSHSPYQNASQSRPPHSPYQNASQSRPSHSPYQNADQLRPTISGVCQPQKAKRSEVLSIVRHEASRKDEGSSTTNKLVQLLREHASWKLGGPSSTAGMSTVHPQFQSGGKQLQLPTDLMQGRNSLYLDPRSYHQTHLQMPNPTQPRPIVASPHYDQQHAHYTHGYNVVEPNPRYIQKRDQATYPGNGSSFYR